MDLKDENITVSKKSKDLKSIKEVRTLDTKDSTKKYQIDFWVLIPPTTQPLKGFNLKF